MATIDIEPVLQTYTINKVKISNIFIDIHSKTISIEIEKIDETGHIDRLTLLASGKTYNDIYDKDVLNDFVLSQLRLTKSKKVLD